MKCPNCGHEFEPDEEEEKPSLLPKIPSPQGVQLEDLDKK